MDISNRRVWGVLIFSGEWGWVRKLFRRVFFGLFFEGYIGVRREERG